MLPLQGAMYLGLDQFRKSITSVPKTQSGFLAAPPKQEAVVAGWGNRDDDDSDAGLSPLALIKKQCRRFHPDPHNHGQSSIIGTT